MLFEYLLECRTHLLAHECVEVGLEAVALLGRLWSAADSALVLVHGQADQRFLQAVAQLVVLGVVSELL